MALDFIVNLIDNYWSVLFRRITQDDLCFVKLTKAPMGKKLEGKQINKETRQEVFAEFQVSEVVREGVGIGCIWVRYRRMSLFRAHWWIRCGLQGKKEQWKMKVILNNLLKNDAIYWNGESWKKSSYHQNIDDEDKFNMPVKHPDRTVA